MSAPYGAAFQYFHGKFNFRREGKNWTPSFSVGFVARTQVHNVGGVIQDKDTTLSLDRFNRC
jgi:hypothetical protein